MLDPYVDYPKTIVPNPSHQGGAQNQADKFLSNRDIWDPQKSTFQANLFNKMCSIVTVYGWKIVCGFAGVILI